MTEDGYGLFVEGKSKERAHRMSFRLNVGPLKAEDCVLHKCDIRCCVNPDHLFLGSTATNNADMHAKGRGVTPTGEANGAAKLTSDQVISIRKDTRFLRVIAADYGVRLQAIYKIKNRKTWKHVA